MPFFMKIDNRITDFIDQAQPFAQPILDQIRVMVHAYCPNVEETIKWNFPCFMYNGKMLCFMASHKKHCSFGFWLAPIMQTLQQNLDGMGIMGKLTTIDQLPTSTQFQSMIEEAMQLIEEGKTNPKKVSDERELILPAELESALKSSELVWNQFNAFTKSQRKDYIVWYNEAKTDATRKKRLDTMLDWISEGKVRMWKYMKK